MLKTKSVVEIKESHRKKRVSWLRKYFSVFISYLAILIPTLETASQQNQNVSEYFHVEIKRTPQEWKDLLASEFAL